MFNLRSILLLTLFSLTASIAQSQDNGVLKIPKDSFHALLADYFKITEDQLASVQQNIGLEEELPVVFFIAQRSGVDPGAVVTVRASGLSWTQTAAHFGVNPWFFFVPITGSLKNTPYDESYRAFKSRNHRVRLTEDEMINWVNLKMLSEEYNRDPIEIVQARTLGKSFQSINDGYVKSNDVARWDVPVPVPQTTQTPATGAPRRHGRHGAMPSAAGAQ